MSSIQKMQNYGTKGTQPRSRDLHLNFGTPHYLWDGESYKLPEVISGEEGNLRAEPPSWCTGRVHSGKGWGRRFGELSPDTKHLHTCQSILLAILFKNDLKMAISQNVAFSHTGGGSSASSFPLPV